MNKKAIRIAAFMAVLTAAALRPASPITEKRPIVPPTISASAADIIAFGECGEQGDNVTWELDINGTFQSVRASGWLDFFCTGNTQYIENRITLRDSFL